MTVAATNPHALVPSWFGVRPWRNNNPGDLRSLPRPQLWDGQIGADNAPGGPFAVFVTRTMGWRALSVCLLTYFERHGLNTVNGIIDRYAPAEENNTAAYKTLVCHQLRCLPTFPLNLRIERVMLAFVTAIALAEGGSRIQWPEDEKEAGVRLALGLPAGNETHLPENETSRA